MTLWEGLLIVVAGMAAGTINTVVGSGTLVTFPVLLALGYPPLVANISNSLGLVPGSVSGAIGYRAELAKGWHRVPRFAVMSGTGGIVGAILLLVLPAEAFATVVPILVLVALILVIAQPWISRWLRRREGATADNAALENSESEGSGSKAWRGRVLMVGVFILGVYGGYFGAAQGIVVVALFGILLDEDLQYVNALKNVLVALVNLVAGIVFVIAGFFSDQARVDWLVVLALAVGAMLGGIIGAKIGRKLSPVILRTVIVVVGLAAIAQLILG